MKHPLILFMLCSLLASPIYGQSSQDLQKVTTLFFESLNAAQQAQILYTFEDTLRTKWTNLPVGLMPRPGLAFGELSDESKIAFHQVLTTLFSSQGYLKTTSIMHLDDILNMLYKQAFEKGEINEKAYKQIQDLDWSYGHYFLSLWGMPNSEKPWGLKMGGHHISFNLTVNQDDYAITPFFIGTDPAEVSSTQFAGLRVLSKEEDYGLMLINSLTQSQQTQATLSQEVPGDIITNPAASQRIDDYYGISVRDFNEHQKGLLEILIQEFTHNLDHEKAHEEYQKILTTGLENIYFAWIGSYERKKPHYYIINGPDFIIEYDNVGWKKDGNHIHAIWREKGNDFGEDILKTHYLNDKH